MKYLADEGILCLGTVCRNRIPDCKLPTHEQLKKESRGTSVEYVADCGGTEILDNKNVLLLSSFAGKHPIEKIFRFDRKKKETITVDCPNVVKQYNKHMGGVDLLDSHIGIYKIILKSRKWYMRLFYHFLELAVKCVAAV